MKIKIFVEGIADEKFISDYITSQYQISLDKDSIIKTNGWTNLKSEKTEGENIRNQMALNTDNEGVNLLIFDADSDYKERLKEIELWKAKYMLEFKIYLWPNNSDSGDFETVLENIINQNNYPIFECWNQYEGCLKEQIIIGRDGPLTTPAKKTKIYGYLEALHGASKSEKNKIKEKNRNYNILEFWDLNSSYLEDLRKFLDAYFLN